MNAGLSKATKDARRVFDDHVLWAAGAFHEFYRALGVALSVIDELNATLVATQELADDAIDRVLDAEP